MGFEVFFVFLGVPEHVQKTSFFLEWLRALSGGLGTQFDASGDPKNRSREGHFGYLWGAFWGTRCLTVFHRFFVLFSIVSTLSSYRYLQCFKHFSIFRNCRNMRETWHRKNTKNRWTIMEKPTQNGHPHRGIKQHVVFHLLFALGATPRRFRGPRGR